MTTSSSGPVAPNKISEISEDTARPRKGYRRYVIAVLLLLLVAVGYVDRINVSVAAPLIQKDLGLSDAALGVMLSSFVWGYAAMMIPTGWFVDKFGKHVVLPIGVLLWTLFAILSTLTHSLGTLIITRIGLGASESPTYPSGNLVIREWAPVAERGVFTGFLQTGYLFGPAVATAPAAWLITQFGWRIAFLYLAACSLLWLIAWLLLYRRPDRARWLGEAERAFLTFRPDAKVDDPDLKPKVTRMSAARLITLPPMIGLMLVNGAQTYVSYFLLTWLPTYMVKEKGFNLNSGGLLISMMYIIALAGVLVFLALHDRFLAPDATQALRGRRRIVIVVLMLVCAAVLGLVPWISGPAGLVTAIAIALIADTAATTLSFALTNDLVADSSSAGQTFALQSFGGQIFGLLAPLVTGFIVQAAGYTPVFVLPAALLVVCAGAGFLLCRRPLQPRLVGGLAV
jgi:MFS family permease